MTSREYYDSLRVYRKGECPIWRKNRLAARIILKSQTKPLSVRDQRVAKTLFADRGIENYLLDQGIASVEGRRRDRYRRWGVEWKEPT